MSSKKGIIHVDDSSCDGINKHSSAEIWLKLDLKFIWKATRFWIILLQFLGCYMYPADNRLIRWVLRCLMNVYVLLITLANSFYAFERLYEEETFISANKFTLTVLRAIDTLTRISDIPCIFLVWYHSRRFIELAKKLDALYGTLTCRKDAVFIAFVITYIIAVFCNDCYSMYNVDSGQQFADDILYYKVTFFPHLSTNCVEYILRFYYAFFRISIVARHVLAGLMLFLILVTSELCGRAASNFRCQLVQNGFVPVEEYLRHVQLATVIRDLDRCFSAVLGIKISAALGFTVSASFDISASFGGGQLNNRNSGMILMWHVLFLIAMTSLCAHSSEQGQKMMQAVDVSLQIESSIDFKREDWVAVCFQRGEKNPPCFTIAGVVVTRENAFQVGNRL
ncbi:uncharacterized protein LOC129591860 [Paramacrobiotus metropolitanus]|uniref:uncharacterized protein LOC129591860 n=1 Tax=Paramacrobiotus metropolitanus TaxID=2943436 RepID=UPI002445D552|nr:uncharacterized protein LOC129591860 [Paramacrobiotus metropolitanus]